MGFYLPLTSSTAASDGDGDKTAAATTAMIASSRQQQEWGSSSRRPRLRIAVVEASCIHGRPASIWSNISHTLSSRSPQTVVMLFPESAHYSHYNFRGHECTDLA